MSWQATNWVIQHSHHKGSALLTLLCIANCANDDGSDCWPNKARLAKDTRLSARQLDRVVNGLEASGELVVQRSTGRYPNHYSFPLMQPNPDKMTGLKTSKPTPSQLRPSNPVISDTNPVIAMAHDPSTEQSEEHPDPPIVPPKPQPSGRVLGIFRHWQSVLSHPQAKLDPKRRRAIQGRLRDYTAEDLKRAIEGCRASPFHMGENSDGKVYDDITLICRDSTHVEMFIAVLNAPKKPKVDPSAAYMAAMGVDWNPREVSTPEQYAALSGRPIEEVRAKWH